MAEFEVTSTDSVVASDGLSIFQDKGISDSAVLSDFVRMELFGASSTLFDLIPFEVVDVEDAVSLVFSKNPTDSVSVSDQVFAALTESLSIDNARALNEKTIRVDFDRAVINNEALNDPASYVFVPITPGAAPIFPQSVQIPISQVNPLFVTVTVTEQTEGATYSAQLIGGFQGVNGEPSDEVAFNFVGKGVRPDIALVIAIDKNTVEVRFTETMLDNDSIRDLSRYSFDNGLAITEIESVDGSVVTLKTTEQTPGLLYTLTILGADLLTSAEADLVAVVDDVQTVVTTDLVQATASDVVATTDQVETQLYREIKIEKTEWYSVTDSVSISFSQSEAPTDSVSVTDSVKVDFVTIEVPESVVVTDQIAREHDAVREASDAVSVTDNATGEIIDILANQVVKGSAEDTVVYGSGADFVIAGS